MVKGVKNEGESQLVDSRFVYPFVSRMNVIVNQKEILFILTWDGMGWDELSSTGVATAQKFFQRPTIWIGGSTSSLLELPLELTK